MTVPLRPLTAPLPTGTATGPAQAPGTPSAIRRGGIDPTTLTRQEKELLQATQGLEAVFLRQIMATMRSSTNSLGGPPDPARAIYQGMFDDTVAETWAKTQTDGLGAKMFLALRKRLPPAAPVDTTPAPAPTGRP